MTCGGRPPRPRFPGELRGFTLVEVLVVVTIVAFVTASAAVRWTGVAQSAAAKASLVRLETTDAHLRTFARSRRRACTLVFDREPNCIRKRYSNPEGAVESPWENLGTGVHVQEIRVAGKIIQRRIVEIPYDVGGTSPTYGLTLKGPGDRTTWIVVAGVSGKSTACATEGEWDAALDLVAR